MADENAAELIKRGDTRFAKRQPLDTMRQEIALNFAPYLAEWTTELRLGDDYASHLIDGTPLLLAREFVGQVGAMLRPAGKQWFWHRHPDEDVNNDRDARDYMDWRSSQMMRIMTDRYTGFHRATKQADEFFGLFGDAVVSVDANEDRSELRIASWHTKHCAWAIGPENKPDTLTRKEPTAARVVKARFKQKIDKLDPKLVQMCEKNGDQIVDLRHEVIPADEYEAYLKPRHKANKVNGWYSVWVDATHKTIIRETWQPTFRYVIPRWVTLSGQAYAISPAATIALPDARLIQQQAMAILEAAEKQVNPPLIAYQDAIRGDVRLDGITWVDRTYDERQGEPLRALELGKNFRLGVESVMRTEAQLMKAFFLDRLRMPDTRNSKSTLEVQFLIDEYIRAALPLFAPMQAEYNDPLLAEVDAQIEILGGYAARQRPKLLAAQREFVFAWNNPLTDMLERQRAQMLSEVAQLGQAVTALEAAAAQAPALQQVDTGKMFRETLMGIGATGWLLSEREAAKNAQAGAQANQMREMIANAPQIADVVHRGAQAAQIAESIPNPAEPSYPMMPSPA